MIFKPCIKRSPCSFASYMTPAIIYCYDAWCGWCYGFSKVMQQVAETYQHKLPVEVLSGGMIPAEYKQHISKTAPYIQGAYKRVEELTGIQFGQDYLWHIFNSGESDWYPQSETPAIALCIFKEYYPEQAVAFATALQYALHYEGRDLTDDEAYRHLLEQYTIPVHDFYSKLHSSAYKEKAHYEFALVKQLQVTGFPAVIMQVSEIKFYLVASGYTDYKTLEQRIETILHEQTIQ